MNNYILISRTFTEITPESCENSDFSDKGFIEEKQQVTFSQLVDLLKECSECSCSPNDYNINNWYSTSYYTTDYRKGIERNESIHFHADNPKNISKYWKMAAKFANL